MPHFGDAQPKNLLEDGRCCLRLVYDLDLLNPFNILALLNTGMIEADAETLRRGDAEIMLEEQAIKSSHNYAAWLNTGMIEADAETLRRGDYA